MVVNTCKDSDFCSVCDVVRPFGVILVNRIEKLIMASDCRTYKLYKRFWRTHVRVLFWGHWYPCFGFLVISPPGFKARLGSTLLTCFAEVNVMYIPKDPPLVLHLLTSWKLAAQPVTSPHASAEVGLGLDPLNCRTRTLALPLPPFCTV